MIKLGDIELTGIIGKIDFKCDEVIDYDKDSITGRKHMVFKRIVDYDEADNIKFEKSFSFDIINISETLSNQLDAIDGSNDIIIEFIFDRFSEKYQGYVSITTFKFDNHNYKDAANIEFTVNEQLPILTDETIMFFAHMITPSTEDNGNIMFLGDYIPVTAPTITHNIGNNTIEMT